MAQLSVADELAQILDAGVAPSAPRPSRAAARWPTAAGWRAATTRISRSPVGCLPRRLRPHFYAIYAYCRWADDLADETAGRRREPAAARLVARASSTRCYAGDAEHPVFVALRGDDRRVFDSARAVCAAA